MFDKEFDEFDYDVINGLNLDTKAIYLNKLFKKTNKSILLVTNSLYEANRLYQTINYHNDNCLLFPMDDFLTSEALASSPELKITRLETLNSLVSSEKHIIITNLMGFLRFLPKVKTFINKKIIINKNYDFNIDLLIGKLLDLGYERTSLVNKTGDFAVRGYVIDIFPISFDDPVRIEFWGDTVDSIKSFNVDTQLSISDIDNITINPFTEFLTFNEKINLEKQCNIIKYENENTISDYIEGVIVYNEYNQILNGYKMTIDEIENYSKSNNDDPNLKYMSNVLKPKNKKLIYFDYDTFDNNLLSIKYDLKNIDILFNDKKGIINQIEKYLRNNTIILCCDNKNKFNKVKEFFDTLDIIITNKNNIFSKKINLIEEKIINNFILENNVYINIDKLFSNNKENKYKSKFKIGKKIKDINKLDIGDYIVHYNHGIGMFNGIKTLTKNGIKKDYIQVDYRGSDKLYIPVEKIDTLSKYASSDTVIPKLSKLGSTEWEKTKLKAKEKAADIADSLIKLYAERETVEGFSFDKDSELQYEFEKEFGFTETDDQIKVINEIKSDMEDKHPMDRLLCGDVGYGKTEVAFRAIFKAILSSKQVALLCPTTILSKQHFDNAIERFKMFPVNIKILNRFTTAKETNIILNDLKEGKIDLLIGTHRILSDDIIFKNLGLLVIDEEQRFGVKHKEKIKSLKNTIDVLTLSATPIPRTLQMTMSGLRSLSLIETPPKNRFPVQTYVLNKNDQIIKDAIYKEVSRNGQVFILDNKIVEFDNLETKIKKIAPDVRVICAHGKMDKNSLENIMMDFINHKYDVLISTTIIETGIDIPNANTLIVLDADRFGLSQLYQLRGRVGRSNKIAYCYLMYEKGKVLTDIALKRLKAIKEFTELGSGFAIAMRDLSLRGAGDIIGSEQAGFIDSVGIEMFMKILDNEIKRIKGLPIEQEEEDKPLIEIATAIDDEYVNDEDIKIEIHKKINMIDSFEKLNEIKKELIDRFGKISNDMEIYMYEELFEKKSKELNIKQIKQTRNFIELYLPTNITNKINGQELFYECTKLSRSIRLSMRKQQIIITLDTVKLDKHYILYLLEILDIIKKLLVY